MSNITKIHGVVLFPAAAMLCMALEASKQTFQARSDELITGYTFKDVTFHQSLSLTSDADGVDVEFHLRSIHQPSEKEISWSEFRLYSYDNDESTEICRGFIRVEHQEAITEVDAGLEFSEETRICKRIVSDGAIACPQTSDTQSMYDIFDQVG